MINLEFHFYDLNKYLLKIVNQDKFYVLFKFNIFPLVIAR